MRATKQRRDAMHALDLTASRVKPAAVLNISKRFRIVPSPLNPCLRTTRPSSAKRNTNADGQPPHLVLAQWGWTGRSPCPHEFRRG
jgi:hypothetical protein